MKLAGAIEEFSKLKQFFSAEDTLCHVDIERGGMIMLLAHMC
jgi:hypothetical protein